ncbi:non-canonical purine NTP pyrophosphatase [Blattabacterium cuenoti]|uniref:non-canonical purine NTP pyrophosphatase n=1 Tax=Blattabacterium cuenoti TaxID=1653831 RepID=UPI0037424EDB
MNHKGFGYHPIFIPNDHKQTFSEMNIDQKNQISHKIKDFKKLIQFINNRNF